MGWDYPSIRGSHIHHLPVLLIFLVLFAGANLTNDAVPGNETGFIDVSEFLNLTNETQTNETTEEFVDVSEFLNLTGPEEQNETLDLPPLDQNETQENETIEEDGEESNEEEFIEVGEFLNFTNEEPEPEILELPVEEKTEKTPELPPGHIDLSRLVLNAENAPVFSDATFASVNTNEEYKKSPFQNSLFVPPGKYRITLHPHNHPIQTIFIDDFEFSGQTLLALDEPDEGTVLGPPGVKFREVYVFNPKAQISGTFTVRAKGTNVYKCKEWNFEARVCEGTWVNILNVTPGELYTIDFDPADPAYGEGSDYFTLTTITIDGNMTDWYPVFENSNNVMYDGIQGIDDADVGQTPDRDLRMYAFTWDEDYYYSYFKRTASGSLIIQLLVYFDVDNDNLLESTDYVVKYSCFNSGLWDSYRYDYVPLNASGDPITGDGVPEPGTVANQQSLESNLPGGSPENIEMEGRVNWSALNLTPGSPVKIHVSSARGAGTALPGQIEDNMNPIDTLIVDVDIDPDRYGSGINGETVAYNHTVTNLGNQNDTVDINTSGTTIGFTVTLNYTNGTQLTDTNGDGVPDVGELAPSQSINITVYITIVGASNGDIDQTLVHATSTNNTNITDSVTDTTYIGDVVIFPDRSGRIINGSTVVYNHTVVSNMPGSNVIAINGTSNNSYVVNFTYLNGTYLTDTDSDGWLDIGNVTQGEATIILTRIAVPASATIGSFDTTTVYAYKATDFSTNSSVTDTTRVSEPIEIYPNRTGVIAVSAGSYVYYQHTVINSLNVSDAGDLTYYSTQNFTVTFYAADMITLLTDTDGDGIIDTGNISPFGGTKDIYAKLVLQVSQVNGTIDYTNITVNSSGIPTFSDYVTDTTTAKLLITYDDPAYTHFQDIFNKTQTVYAKGYGLDDYKKVYFVWYDSNGTIVQQTSSMVVDKDEEASNNLALDYSFPSGTYLVYLHDDKTDIVIAVESFLVYGEPNVTVVSPNGGENWSLTQTIYYNVTDDSGENVTALIQYSDDAGVSWNNLTTQVLVPALCISDNVSFCVEGQFNYSWDTTTVLDGTNYLIKVITNNTFFLDSDTSDAVFTINNSGISLCYISGVITSAFGSTVFSETLLYNSTGEFISNQTEDYNYTVRCNLTYDFIVRPDTGNFKELRVWEINVTTNITEVVDLEDSPNDMQSPESVLNWTEAISWFPNETMNYSAITINVSYGNSSNLAFYKCANWTYDQRNCTDDNWTYVTDIPNGPGLFIYNFTPGDPGAGIANKPNVTTMLKVYDVTGLPEAGRINAGSLVGIFYNGTQVNFTYGKSYRIEMYLNNTDNNTNGIIKDPYYDNIQEELGIDMVGADAPNITVVIGAVTINAFTPTNVAGTESGTRRLTWDAAHPHKVIELLELGDLVKLWFVVDNNQTNQSLNNATFYGDVQGTLNDAVQINPFNTSGPSDCMIISSPGTYALNQDVVGAPNTVPNVPGVTKACVILASSDIDFSCYGYNITNNNTLDAVGIIINASSSLNYTNVTVQDCPGVSGYERGLEIYRSSEDTVRNLTAYNSSFHGINIRYTSHTILENNTAHNNTLNGITVSSGGENVTVRGNIAYDNGATGIAVASSMFLLSDNLAYDNANMGFQINNYGTATNNTARDCVLQGFYISNLENSTFSDNVAYNNSAGFSIGITINSTFTNELAHSNSNEGFLVWFSSNNTFNNITSSNNTDSGIELSNSVDQKVYSSYFYNNSLSGIRSLNSNDTTIDDAEIYNNTNYGIVFNASNNTLITNSRIFNNTGYGLYQDNSNYTNSTNTNITYNGLDGIRLDADSVQNTLESNFVCYNAGIDLNSANSSNAGTLDICDTYQLWNEASHPGCTFRCTEVWHRFYGDVNGSLLLAPNQADIFYSWLWDGQDGKVYVVSINATIDWASLIALGRNTTQQNSTNDFTELDSLLGISTEPDNINATYSYDGSNPIETRNWTLFEHYVPYLPVANSSVFNTFYTGIAWDSSQDGGGGQFDPADNEDVVFVTEINGSASNDYEIMVPATLATYKGGSVVEFWVELD